jgi:hypothetical protein
MITMRPAMGDLSPKKATDQKAFIINCIMNIIKATFTFGSPNPTRHTRKADIPISIYNIVQTGPNSQLGGLKDGFSRVAYHVGMEALVNIEPMKPAARQTPMLIANLRISIALMCSISHTPKLYIPLCFSTN